MDRVEFYKLLRERASLSEPEMTSILKEAIACDDKENTLSIISDIMLDDAFFDFLMTFPELRFPLSLNLGLNESRIEKLAETDDKRILSHLTHYVGTSKEVLRKISKGDITESDVIRIINHWNMDDGETIRDVSAYYAPYRMYRRIAQALAANNYTPRDMVVSLLDDCDEETLQQLLHHPHITAEEGRKLLDKVAAEHEYIFNVTNNLENCIILGLDSSTTVVRVEDLYELINLNAYHDFTDILKMIILNDREANGWVEKLFAHLGIDAELGNESGKLSRDMVANILGWDAN
jgi:hypothetical protein